MTAQGLSPDFSWVTPHLAVGGRFGSSQAGELAREHCIVAVVDLRDEDRHDARLLAAHGLALLHLPTPDRCAVDADSLAAGVDFACGHLRLGHRTLVHCTHGIGRSAVLALCVMVARGWSPMAALERMKDRRAAVSPSPAQFECWCEWLDARRQQGHAIGPSPDFDMFARVAYRHLSEPG